MLDKNQLKAVNIGNGPALIVAGPGSGKTKVLTHHIKYLIEEQNVLPSRILVITFSKAASVEMKSRFNSLITGSNDVNFGTFHAIYYKLLRMFKGNVASIIDDKSRYTIIEKIVGDTNDYEYVSSKISFYKSRIYHDNLYELNNLIPTIEAYNSTLQSLNLMDYDDILINTYEMLRDNTDIRNRIKSLFDHILVDEFQDINEYQYEVLKMITNGNLYAVGDDDQSIYGFRGADGKIMQRFINDFKDTSLINLNINYRSLGSIVRASDIVIKDNPDRIKDIDIIPYNDLDDTGFNIVFCKEYSEINNKLLVDLNKLSEKYNDIAVLVRTNKDVLRFRKLIYNEKDERVRIYNSKVLDAYIYYLDYIMTSNNISLIKIINLPNRYIPTNIITHSTNLDDITKMLKGKYCYADFEVFIRHIKTLKKSVPFSFALYLENIVGIKKFMMEKELITDLNDAESIFENIRTVSRSCADLEQFKTSLEKMKEKELVIKKREREKINIMTFHASKGLEFDACLIPDVVEGKIPGRGSIGSMDVYEERRLFYVAMTRAKKELYMYTVKNEESAVTLPSRFISNLLDYSSSNSSSSNHSSNLSNTASSSSSSSI